ncbi:hypothetical protein DFJ58DRAFT_775356 [Suillus subalutaceus]|uniref:uncharacterized protein n=1 Tax=Suillus subalutaceus TaxID=48586 RepID=UPI001B885A2D|nr:uncharacterized protein DFJ58DRAFT_775356 [Suillus subalutaceus]KAG1862845.1 hypothetical protein DFJ58DRAFT_775356 [Suillus subalutaceus]
MLSHGALICTSMLFFALWMDTPSPHLHDDIPVYSPAIGAVESVIVRFNGTLDFPSIYRGPPSPEIDAAWARIAHDVIIHLPRSKYPPKFGGGFMVSMEAPHQLHCLNLLRKASWPEYIPHVSWYIVFLLMYLLLIIYTDHCIEMIRQNIMCNVDVMMITWDWVQGHKHAVHIDKSEVTRFEDTVDLPLPSDLMHHNV